MVELTMLPQMREIFNEIKEASEKGHKGFTLYRDQMSVIMDALRYCIKNEEQKVAG